MRAQKVRPPQGKICPDGSACGPEGDLPMFLDSFRKSIINQLIAADEGRILQDSLAPYFRAFTGAFKPDMPFTFYFGTKNKPLMLVYDATPIAARSSHAAFIERCDRIKRNILPIAGFMQELANTGYVTETPLDFRDRPPLPPDYENCWRKYQHFYMDAINALSYACFTKLTPTQKLCDAQARFNPKALAGQEERHKDLHPARRAPNPLSREKNRGTIRL
jgi:hypothetical protein